MPEKMDVNQDFEKEAAFLATLAIPLYLVVASTKALFDMGSATVSGLKSIVSDAASGVSKAYGKTFSDDRGLPALGRAIGSSIGSVMYPSAFNASDEFRDISADDIRLYNMLKMQTNVLKKEIAKEKAKRKAVESAIKDVEE